MANPDCYEMGCIYTGVATDSAIQVIDPASDEVLWIPFSQILEMHGREERKRTEGTIKMTYWIAQKKGLA